MAKTIQTTKYSVTLGGLTPIMFNRYPGDNTTKLQPMAKLYRNQKGQLVLPSLNVGSFLCAENTRSAPRDYYDKREYKTKALGIRGFCVIEPFEVPFLRDGKPIVADKEGDAGVYIDRRVARLKDGIPSPQERPVLPLPWSLTFTVTVFPNDKFTADEIRTLFDVCGFSIGFGAYRGVFGKFDVQEWKQIS